MNKKSYFIFLAIFILFSKLCLAWSGYDNDNKTEIEIEEGNLVREGLVIQFFEAKTNSYKSAKVIFMESVAGGVRLQLQDLSNKKERIFIMN